METRTADVIKTEIIPYIYYGDRRGRPGRWLARAFRSSKEEMREPTPRGGVHGEMPTLDGRRIMLGQRPEATPTNTSGNFPSRRRDSSILLPMSMRTSSAAIWPRARLTRRLRIWPYGRSYGARDPRRAMSGISRTPPKG